MDIFKIMEYDFNKNLMFRDIGEVRMVYNKENGDMYELNDVGKDIFVLLEQEVGMKQLLETLCESYDVEKKDIIGDVTEFIVRMIELGAIKLPVNIMEKMFPLRYVYTINVTDYQEVRAAVGWEEISTVQAQKGIDNSYAVVSCKANDRIIGIARVLWDGGYTAFIVDVMVKPEWQKRGIGTKMLELLIEKLESTLQTGEKLMINLYSSKGKERFYEKNGFAAGSGMVRWIRK